MDTLSQVPRNVCRDASVARVLRHPSVKAFGFIERGGVGMGDSRGMGEGGGVELDGALEVLLQHCTDAASSLMEPVADPAHNMPHVLAVTEHVRKALVEADLSLHQQAVVLMAALLHEVDDDKLFATEDDKHARDIMTAAFDASSLDQKSRKGLLEDVLRSINLVSAKKNKNSTVDHSELWKLIVRDADRVEAVGEVGIARTYAYNKKAGAPLCLDSTSRAKTEEELWNIATPERFAQYSGSASMIDHCYDKLLHVCHCSSGNPYFQRLFDERRGDIVRFVLQFGRTGTLDIAELEELEAKHCRAPSVGKRKRELGEHDPQSGQDSSQGVPIPHPLFGQRQGRLYVEASEKQSSACTGNMPQF
eukprot:6336901-Amphidinium_carterae.1